MSRRGQSPDVSRVALVRSALLDWYAVNGRALPWRETDDPYAILVSEVMLQQTQVDRVREAAIDELRDEVDDLRNELGHLRHQVRHPEPEVASVLEVPGGRLFGEGGTRAGGGLVDLVVDVGDVVDEGHVVAGRLQPRPHPHPDDERTRIADVRAGVDGRAAEVHADGARRRRELDERA